MFLYTFCLPYFFGYLKRSSQKRAKGLYINSISKTKPSQGVHITFTTLHQTFTREGCEGLWKSGEHLVKALWMFERLIQNSKKLIYRELATNFSSCVKTFIIYDLTISWSVKRVASPNYNLFTIVLIYELQLVCSPIIIRVLQIEQLRANFGRLFEMKMTK